METLLQPTEQPSKGSSAQHKRKKNHWTPPCPLWRTFTGPAATAEPDTLWRILHTHSIICSHCCHLEEWQSSKDSHLQIQPLLRWTLTTHHPPPQVLLQLDWIVECAITAMTIAMRFSQCQLCLLPLALFILKGKQILLHVQHVMATKAS